MNINNPQRNKRHRMQKFVMGERFERLAVDIASPFTVTSRGNCWILVVMDYFSKLTEIFPFPNIQAETVAVYSGDRINDTVVLAKFIQIRGDNSLFREMCHIFEINKSITTPLHPRSDGME